MKTLQPSSGRFGRSNLLCYIVLRAVVAHSDNKPVLRDDDTQVDNRMC